MTTHELARVLLAGPDQPVYVVNEDASAPEPVTGLRVLGQEEWKHHHTGQPVLDANDDALPENYTVVVADTDTV